MSGRPVAAPRPLPTFRKVFADGWRSLLGWMVGIAAPAFLYLPIFPSLSGNAQMQDLINSLPKQLTQTINYQDISTGAGYTQSTFFGLIGFLLISIAVIGWGAAALGGDEESGQLELTLAHGVSRVGVALQRFAGLAVKVLALTSTAFLVVLLWNGPSGLKLDAWHLAGTSLLFGGLALLTGSVALLVGAVTGRRVFGVGGGAVVAVLGYVANALGNQSAGLGWLHAVSPYHWAFGHNPLINGAHWGTVIVFVAASVVLGLATALVLDRRDIGR